MHVTTTDLGISLSHPLDHIRKFAFVYPSIPSRPSILIVFSSPALQAAHTIATANETPFKLQVQIPKVINLDGEIVNV